MKEMGSNEESLNRASKLFGKKSNLHRFINKYEKQFKMLTDRELEVLCLVANEHQNSEIAERLSISRLTVQNHRSRIRKKLLIKNKSDYIKYALAFDLVSF